MEKRRWALRVRRPSRATGRPPAQAEAAAALRFPLRHHRLPPATRSAPTSGTACDVTCHRMRPRRRRGPGCKHAHAGPERSSAGHRKWARPRTTLLRLGPVGTVFLRPIHPIRAGIWGCGSACNAELPAQKPRQALRLDIVGL